MLEMNILNEVNNGKFKEYYENGNLKTEGEYLNGKKLNAKVYDFNIIGEKLKLEKV